MVLKNPWEGSYTITGLPTGSYRVSAQASGYVMEYYNGTSNQQQATPVAVTAPNNTPNINVILTPITTTTTPTTTTTSTTTTVTTTKSPTLSSITVTPTTPANLKVGFTYQFIATGSYSDGSTADISSTVKWASSDPTIAAFTQPSGGQLMGMSIGTVTITATLSGIISPPVSLTVSSPLTTTTTTTPITSTTTTATTTTATTGAISGHVYQSNGTTPIGGVQVDVFPIGYSGGWGTNTNTDGSYTIAGLPAGNYTVEAWGGVYIMKYYGGNYDPQQATPVAVTAPNNTPNINFSLDIGGTISGHVYQYNGTTPITGASVSVSLLNNNWGTTTIGDGSYTITGLPTGSYRVSAQASGYVMEYYNGTSNQQQATPVAVTAPNNTPNINVILTPITTTTTPTTTTTSTTTTVTTTKSPTLSSITVTPTTPANLKVGFTYQFIATGSYSDGSTADISSTVKWASSDPTIAAFTQPSGGQLMGMSIGTVTITATLSGIISPPVSLTVSSAVTTTTTTTPVTTTTTTATTTATTNTAPALSINSYSFSPNPVILGNSVNANISMTGGAAGTYTLDIWEDIPLWPDKLINSFSFTYDGTATSKSFSFAPTNSGSYHLSLILNGNTLWSQTSDASRLTVNNAIPIVKIENVDLPSAVTVEQTYKYDVTLRNDSSNQAVVSLNIDSSIVGHISTSSVTLSASTMTDVPITATFALAGVGTVTYTVLYNNQILDSLTKSITVKTAAASSVTDWRANIQPGDILLARSDGVLGNVLTLMGDFWIHCGIYVGDGEVVEALSDGVAEDSITNWDYPNKTCVEVRRVSGVDATEIDKIVNFCLSQLGKPYNLDFVSESYDPNAISWYCSELVWAAYMQVGINIDSTPDSLVVSPQDINNYEGASLIGSHMEDSPSDTVLTASLPLCLLLFVFSPVDIVVTDPDGLIVSTELSQIKGSVYAVGDFDHNGHLEAIISIPNIKNGNYQIEVTPKPNALPTDVYSLKAQFAGQTVSLANDIQISNIPVQGYSLIGSIPPLVATANASNVGYGSVRLNGDLTSLGTSSSANVSFEWGTASGNYSSETVVQKVNTTGIFNSSLNGLLPNTTYYFRARVETVPVSGSGETAAAPNVAFSSLTSYGVEGSFTTSAAPIPWLLIIIIIIICVSVAIICIFTLTAHHRKLVK